jgi:hypothetical protein
MPARDLGYALVPRISRARLPGRLLLLDGARMGHDSAGRPVPAAANERTFYMGRCRYQVSYAMLLPYAGLSRISCP